MINIRLLEEPDLKDPILICGLPGSGFVGKLALEHLINELGAKLFGVIYSHNFPPQAIIQPDGTVDIIKNELYYWRSKDSSNDLILYTGDSQPITPDADYEVADRILELTRKMGAKKVYALAAYITGGFVKIPRVFAAATETTIIDDLKKYGVVLMTEGSITGMNGLLVGLAKIHDMQGVSLLGETSGYIIDANASKAVLEVFTKMMNLKIDMTSLDQRAKSTEAVVKTLDQLRHGQEEQPIESSPKDDRDLGYIS
ncbi:MAG: proteasome assembly chaperone family protein [Thaumarchaeota archaeon]|nr:proteasome assembly chaperone family protein [Nitrososphaerota archaeon]MCL5318015.1 proteasome assembly chaperone family protein [Nitrososphaerota archaeon]